MNGTFESIKEDIINNGFKLLDIRYEHLPMIVTLPFIHKDPFDRLLIAQAISENLSIVSKDEIFSNYVVNLSEKSISEVSVNRIW